MAKAIASITMKSRQHAIVLALFFSLLPFLGWIAVAIMALVTLQKGAREGALILFCLALPMLIVEFMQPPVTLDLNNLLLFAVIAWGGAIGLRRGLSWGALLQIATVIGVMMVIAAHWYSNDIQQFWIQTIMNQLKSLSTLMDSPVSVDTLQSSIQLMSRLASGVVIVFAMLNTLISLTLARSMQASLYNPGGLRQELLNVQLNKIFASLCAMVVALVFMTGAHYLDILVVLAVPFTLTGMSVVHRLLVARQAPLLWYIAFYGLLITMTPYVLGLLVLIALTDTYTGVIRQAMRQA